jgi:hypothetical protein
VLPFDRIVAVPEVSRSLKIVNVVDARHVRDFVLWLRFGDGTEGEVDLAAKLDGEIFEPLKDPSFFRRFAVNAELRTVTWPNGADFAPEFLHEHVRAVA